MALAIRSSRASVSGVWPGWTRVRGSETDARRARELFSRARPAYSELLHAHLQSAAFQTQEHSCALGTANYPIGCLKSIEDVPPLHVFQSFDLAGFSVGRRIYCNGGLRLRLQIAEWWPQCPCRSWLCRTPERTSINRSAARQHARSRSAPSPVAPW